MGPWSRVRVAKCQMLVTGLFVLLLGLSVAAMAVLTYFGAHFTVISRVSLERNPYEAMHHWAFSVGVSLAGLLTLGAVLCAAATVREAAGLMAGVEDAVLDTYDLVYEQAVQSPSSVWGQKLAAIQDTFQCCGKQSPFSLLGDAEAGLCPGELAKREASPARCCPRPQKQPAHVPLWTNLSAWCARSQEPTPPGKPKGLSLLDRQTDKWRGTEAPGQPPLLPTAPSELGHMAGALPILLPEVHVLPKTKDHPVGGSDISCVDAGSSAALEAIRDPGRWHGPRTPAGWPVYQWSPWLALPCQGYCVLTLGGHWDPE
ncbi:tetraspanin-32 isoform X2 [Elephas maximus indicus]|uniref:tetraspanin-32 isoform X2 n=1 Tax=Elephas maximus indicus TaxID=99487 RepID=UPI002116662F|nr:tetraspanin-32 isoform X2 [Elephas maximus indicus]